VKIKRGFASDNGAGVHPDVMRALVDCNKGHVTAYGDDIYTQRAIRKIKEHFGNDIDVFFVYGGTGANVTALKAMTQSYEAIICPARAHIYEDETGAPERFTSCKLIPIPTGDGKLNLDLIQPYLGWIGDEHRAQPRVISITQATEFETVYSLSEIKKVSAFARQHGMLLHMDGARIANAAVTLGLGFKEFTKDAGVDVLSFGGTKNGMMFGEAVVFFNRDLAKNFKFTRKHGTQLHSKMRFISVQFEELLSNDLWKRNAENANRMASLLEKEVRNIKGLKIVKSVDANSVFVNVPSRIVKPLQIKFAFYVWTDYGETSDVRWMCSRDTAVEDVMKFVVEIKKLIK
jgi:threonine aldolase